MIVNKFSLSLSLLPFKLLFALNKTDKHYLMVAAETFSCKF